MAARYTTRKPTERGRGVISPIYQMRQILIADDEWIIRKGIRDCLAENGYTQIYEAKNGADAIRVFKDERPEIAILDVSMPGMSGMDAYKEMRSIKPYTQVIFVSAYTKPEYLREAILNEAVDYIFKPIAPELLIKALGRADERLVKLGVNDFNASGAESRSDASRQLAAEMLNYIQANYARPINVAMIAEAAHISSAYACTLFKKHTGDTLINCLTSRRLTAAAELLLSTELPAYAVANRVGYQDYRYFKQVFIKKYGVAPSEYRGGSGND